MVSCMNNVEIIGIIASILLSVSMIIKSTSIRNNIIMRILNTIGSLFFLVYGIVLPAYSTAIFNSIVILINIYHIICLKKELTNKLVD